MVNEIIESCDVLLELAENEELPSIIHLGRTVGSGDGGTGVVSSGVAITVMTSSSLFMASFLAISASVLMPASKGCETPSSNSMLDTTLVSIAPR